MNDSDSDDEEVGGEVSDKDIPIVTILTDENNDGSDTSDNTETSVESSEQIPGDEDEPEGEFDTTVEPDDDEYEQEEMYWLKRKINNQMRHHIHPHHDLV